MQFLDALQSSINSRDIAIAFWFVIIATWVSFKAEIRSSVWQVLKYLFVKPIFLSLTLLLTYTASLCFFLHQLGFWGFEYLKMTIFWFFGAAVVSLFRLSSVKEDTPYVKNALRDNIKLIAVIEFIITAHTFSIIGELILVPALTVIGMMIAVAEGKAETKQVANLLYAILFIYIAIAGWMSIKDILDDHDTYLSINTLSEFLLPIVLSISVIPLLAVMLLYMSYETAFIGFRFSTNSNELSKYALWKSLTAFRGNREKLSRWKRQLNYQDICSKADISNSIKNFKLQLYREANPEPVDLKDGWQPQQARRLLEAMGLKTSHYECHGTDNYSASSQPLEIDNEVLPNNVTFHIYGNRDVVDRLKLRLDVNYKNTEKEAIQKLIEVADHLNKASLNGGLAPRYRH